MKYLVTGAAGFIGMHSCLKLLKKNFNVIGIDNLNSYYDVNLKLARLKILKDYKNFRFLKVDIRDKNKVSAIFKKFSRNSRIKYALSYVKFCKYITNQKINVIFSTVSLFHKVRNWNRANFNNYVEIYIETDIKKVIKRKSKYFYKGNHKNVMGKNLKAEFPKNPDIIIKNNFEKSLNNLSKELIKKIKQRSKQ